MTQENTALLVAGGSGVVFAESDSKEISAQLSFSLTAQNTVTLSVTAFDINNHITILPICQAVP